MRKIYKILVSFLFLILVAIIIFSSFSRKSTEWHVLMMALPTEIKTNLSELSVVSYILVQTHKPIFTQGAMGAIESEILTDWNLSLDGKVVKFCIKENLSFDINRKFLLKDLLNSIEKLGHEPPNKVKEAGSGCVEYTYSQPFFDIFKILSNIRYSPSVQASDPRYEIGLGDYEVSSFTEKKIILKRKNEIPNGINLIYLTAYEGNSSFFVGSTGRLIDDPNRVSYDLIPDVIRQSHKEYRLTQLQSGVLILNIKDSKLRKQIYNCLDIPNIVASFVPDLNDKLFIKTILPVGVLGGKEGVADQNCSKISKFKNSELQFFNWKHSVQKNMEQFFADSELKYGIKIKVKPIDNDLLMEIGTNLYKSDFLSIFGVDAVSGLPIDYYSGLIEPGNSLPVISNDSLFAAFKKLKNARREEALEIVQKIEFEIKNIGVMLPLFQPLRKFYYPKDVSGIVTTDDKSLLSPNISKIRL